MSGHGQPIGGGAYAAKVGVPYICGNCGKENQISAGDAIMCQDCACRILYKKRTKRIVQFEAR
jgi:DNA-directed RNA polymerase I, II, and III subunit RPABC4